jgi:hypothetical protein
MSDQGEKRFKWIASAIGFLTDWNSVFGSISASIAFGVQWAKGWPQTLIVLLAAGLAGAWHLGLVPKGWFPPAKPWAQAEHKPKIEFPSFSGRDQFDIESMSAIADTASRPVEDLLVRNPLATSALLVLGLPEARNFGYRASIVCGKSSPGFSGTGVSGAEVSFHIAAACTEAGFSLKLESRTAAHTTILALTPVELSSDAPARRKKFDPSQVNADIELFITERQLFCSAKFTTSSGSVPSELAEVALHRADIPEHLLPSAIQPSIWVGGNSQAKVWKRYFGDQIPGVILK